MPGVLIRKGNETQRCTGKGHVRTEGKVDICRPRGDASGGTSPAADTLLSNFSLQDCEDVSAV